MQHPILLFDRTHRVQAANESRQIPLCEVYFTLWFICIGFFQLLLLRQFRWFSRRIAGAKASLSRCLASCKAKAVLYLLIARAHSKLRHAYSARRHDRLTEQHPMPMLPALAKYDALIRYQQTGEDAEQVASVAGQLRQLRNTFHLSREALAAQLGIDLELLIIVENGDGNPEIAQQLLARTKQLLQVPD